MPMKSLRKDSPVILRESQQRRPLCEVGWVSFSSEDVDSTEIIPETTNATEYN